LTNPTGERMMQTSASRLRCLLCGLALVSGSFAFTGRAMAQQGSPVTVMVGNYVQFEFLGTQGILIDVPDGGQSGTYVGYRNFRVQANTAWGFGQYAFGNWSPSPPAYVLTPSGVPFAGVPGTTLGSLSVTASGLTFPTPAQIKTGTLTVTIYGL
jgi:hypothetical protein